MNDRPDFMALYRMYARKYAYAPIRMTPCEAFSLAFEDGAITREQYEAARKHFKSRWNYSGE